VSVEFPAMLSLPFTIVHCMAWPEALSINMYTEHVGLGCLMAEMADAGKNHRQIVFVGGFNYLVVPD